MGHARSLGFERSGCILTYLHLKFHQLEIDLPLPLS